MRRLILIFFLSLFVFRLFGISGDSLQISLLTVSPWSDKVYTIYGHTAIRICDSSKKWDIVFNYGTFDQRKPNFIYHFVKGETDYYLAMEGYDSFVRKYKEEEKDATVFEQILNLKAEEKEEMLRMLSINLLPENKEYRYNFLFDNCTTRPRDIIEKVVGNIVYPPQQKQTTFRTLIHEYTKSYPWMTFGIDLLIGNGADSTINLRQEMFLPEKLMSSLGAAYVNDSLEQRPIVSSTQIIIRPTVDDTNQKSSSLTPMKTGIILLIHTLVFGIFGIIYKRKFRIFFGLIYLQATIAGLIVWFVALFSVHPCTFPNLNIFFFHPFYLIAFLGCALPKTYRFITWFHWINLLFLPVFLMAWPFILQDLSSANIPYILCLWIGSGVWLKLRTNAKES